MGYLIKCKNIKLTHFIMDLPNFKYLGNFQMKAKDKNNKCSFKIKRSRPRFFFLFQYIAFNNIRAWYFQVYFYILYKWYLVEINMFLIILVVFFSTSNWTKFNSIYITSWNIGKLTQKSNIIKLLYCFLLHVSPLFIPLIYHEYTVYVNSTLF